MSRYEESIFGYQTSGNIDYKLKSETGWPDGKNGGNTSHMNISPYGGKMDHESFYLPIVAILWTSTEFNNETTWIRSISNDQEGVGRNYMGKLNGNYIRCVKD